MLRDITLNEKSSVRARTRPRKPGKRGIVREHLMVRNHFRKKIATKGCWLVWRAPPAGISTECFCSDRQRLIGRLAPGVGTKRQMWPVVARLSAQGERATSRSGLQDHAGFRVGDAQGQQLLNDILSTLQIQLRRIVFGGRHRYRHNGNSIGGFDENHGRGSP